MGISIKRAETERMARKLALRKGVSLTDAIHEALAADLERTDPTPEEEGEWRRGFEEMSAKFRAMGLHEGPSREEIEAEMYDEDGLPI